MLLCGSHRLDLSRPAVMGIVNVTPDSFSDGGRFDRLELALKHADTLVAAGADIIDIGGESTRPGAKAVSAAEEIARVVPLIAELKARHDLPISIDTSKAEVIEAAVDAGASMINDVYALRRPGALQAAAASGLPVCLMHMAGEPQSMQDRPRYDDVVAEVKGFLAARIEQCQRYGLGPERLLIDPGFGFGKGLPHNLDLLARLDDLLCFGLPLLVGLSRKSMLGQITGAALDGRMAASVAAAMMALQRGASILRVHDVAAHVHAVQVFNAVAGPRA